MPLYGGDTEGGDLSRESNSTLLQVIFLFLASSVVPPRVSTRRVELRRTTLRVVSEQAVKITA